MPKLTLEPGAIAYWTLGRHTVNVQSWPDEAGSLVCKWQAGTTLTARRLYGYDLIPVPPGVGETGAGVFADASKGL